MLLEQKKKLEEVLEIQGLLYFFNSKNIYKYIVRVYGYIQHVQLKTEAETSYKTKKKI